jgi:glycosyltransferase involved in cell wall biosynthesis
MAMKRITQIAEFQKGNGKVIEPPIKRAQPQATSPRPDLVCLSHLRWDFVTQRPQHLLNRCARDRRVFFVEEPVFDGGSARLEIGQRESGVWVVVPHLPEGLRSGVAVEAMLTGMIDRLFAERAIRDHVLWYYTPMALGFTRHLRPLATVYDCMDELSAFRGAPPALRAREAELFRRADLVFTGGQSLYEVKRDKHPAVYAFPSSIERAHFARARGPLSDPQDQAAIPGPRLGFFGVLDERFDAELLAAVAAARPRWQFVMIGPVVKIDPASLPRRANIHYLGGRRYEELPAYLSGWDVALMPFAMNESTRFISPTKTPEYLAAGRPVVSTPVRDVVRPYGTQGLVEIAATAEEFVAAAEKLLAAGARWRREWLARVDAFLAQSSWDETWARMSRLIDEAVASRQAAVAKAARAASAGTGRAAAGAAAGAQAAAS